MLNLSTFIIIWFSQIVNKKNYFVDNLIFPYYTIDMKKIKVLREKLPGRTHLVSLRVNRSVADFMSYNADEWGRSTNKQWGFIAGLYAAGNFEELERQYNGPDEARKQEKKEGG